MVIGIPKPVQRNELSFRDSSRDVAQLQQRLNERFHELGILSIVAVSVDSYFGPLTLEAVKYLQCLIGIPVDGVVGPQTWKFLEYGMAGLPILTKGDRGYSVRAVQNTIWRTQHIPLVIDGVFGPETVRAVQSYQRHFQIKPNGIVSAETWRKIVSDRLLTLPCSELLP